MTRSPKSLKLLAGFDIVVVHWIIMPQKSLFIISQVGCTNLKRLMLYMGDHLPIETIDWPWVEDRIYLEPALQHASFLNKTLTIKEKLQRINDYYKFIIVRNPFERLLSGYRNKVEKPIRYTGCIILHNYYIPTNNLLTLGTQYS